MGLIWFNIVYNSDIYGLKGKKWCSWDMGYECYIDGKIPSRKPTQIGNTAMFNGYCMLVYQG